jgi:hypothetical protein
MHILLVLHSLVDRLHGLCRLLLVLRYFPRFLLFARRFFLESRHVRLRVHAWAMRANINRVQGCIWGYDGLRLSRVTAG